MSTLTIIKFGVDIALGIGNQAIVGTITKQIISDCQNPVMRACAKFASMTLAGVATAACSAHVNEQIDQIAGVINAIKEHTKPVEETPQEG